MKKSLCVCVFVCKRYTAKSTTLVVLKQDYIDNFIPDDLHLVINF